MESVVPKTTIDIGEALWLKLQSFMAVTDAVMAKVIRRAISDHIERELLSNPSMEEKYQVHMKHLLASTGGNVALIASRKKTRKSGSSRNGNEPGAQTKPY